MSYDDEEYEHESYGLVQFSRISHGPGRTRLFGSSILNHMTTICLRVQRGRLAHGLSEDRFFTNHQARNPIIEVEMSAAQFSELLTTMNMGSGVPCTIRYVEGERVNDPPDLPLEVERVRDGFRDRMRDLAGELERRYEFVRKILLAGKAPNKGDREKILREFETIITEMKSNIPFVATQFQEATDRIVAAGKAEVDHFVTAMVQKTGIERLQEMQNRPVLPSGDDDG